MEAAPPGHQEFNETGGVVRVDLRPVVVIEPPLAGERYVPAAMQPAIPGLPYR